MHRPHGHANRPPVVLKEVHGRGDPEICEAEIFFGLGIERGPMRKLLDGADSRCHCLVDFAMINHELAEFRWRPGKDEQVVPLPRLHLGEGALTNLLHRNNIDRDVGIVPLTPVFGQHVNKPLVELRQEVGPLGDLERLLAGAGKRKKGPKAAAPATSLRKLRRELLLAAILLILGTLVKPRRYGDPKTSENRPGCI